MSSPFTQEVLQEALSFLETEFPLLSNPPETTREGAVAVLCHRLRYALAEEGWTPELEQPPIGEEFRPYGWTPDLWDDREDYPDPHPSLDG